MRNRKYTALLLVILSISQLFVSCTKENDYSSITYRNYLRYEIVRAQSFLRTRTEGTQEGAYKPGSIQVYQASIDEAELVCDTLISSQEEIDRSYQALITSGEVFYDQMVPFKTIFAELIADADFTLAYNVEGGQEGNVKPGSKSAFQAVIEGAKLVLNRPDLTQRMIDAKQAELISAIYLFDASIIGQASLFVENQSFEIPGYNTVNFAEVPGWNLFGKVETWAPKTQVYQGGTSLLPAESVPDGEFVVKLGSYTQGMYQALNERIHPNAKYTLDYKASLLQNYPDAFGKSYKVVVLSRVIVFDKEIGDYRFSNIIGESYDTLGISPGGFMNIKQEIDIDASSVYLERKIAVDFLVRHTFETAKPIWAESYVALDDIRLYRKLK